MQRIKIGDTVEVIAGVDKGKRGEVIRVEPKKNRVVVDGVNIRKKHQRPRQAGRQQTQAGILDFAAPINMSNVMVICPETDLPTRVGFRINEDGEKVRYSRRSGKDIV